MRPIDAVQALKDINWHHKPTPVSEFESGFNQGLNQAMWIITHAPTLTPPNEPRMINADKLAKRIAGHSNYHGDSILAAIYCAVEGKESDIPIQPIENPPNEWVSVEERLPEEKQRVIVRCERVGTSVGWILWGNWMTDIGPGAGKVTHWMPLPAEPDRRPPEGEKK